MDWIKFNDEVDVLLLVIHSVHLVVQCTIQWLNWLLINLHFTPYPPSDSTLGNFYIQSILSYPILSYPFQSYPFQSFLFDWIASRAFGTVRSTRNGQAERADTLKVYHHILTLGYTKILLCVWINLFFEW